MNFLFFYFLFMFILSLVIYFSNPSYAYKPTLFEIYFICLFGIILVPIVLYYDYSQAQYRKNNTEFKGI